MGRLSLWDHDEPRLHEAALLVNARPFADEGARDFWVYLRGDLPVLHGRLARLPGARYDPASGHWRVPSTAANAQCLARLADAWRLTVYPMAGVWLQERAAMDA